VIDAEISRPTGEGAVNQHQRHREPKAKPTSHCQLARQCHNKMHAERRGAHLDRSRPKSPVGQGAESREKTSLAKLQRSLLPPRRVSNRSPKPLRSDASTQQIPGRKSSLHCSDHHGSRSSCVDFHTAVVCIRTRLWRLVSAKSLAARSSGIARDLASSHQRFCSGECSQHQRQRLLVRIRRDPKRGRGMDSVASGSGFGIRVTARCFTSVQLLGSHSVSCALLIICCTLLCSRDWGVKQPLLGHGEVGERTNLVNLTFPVFLSLRPPEILGFDSPPKN